MQRSRTKQWFWQLCLQLTIKLFQAREHTSHSEDRIAPILWPAAMGHNACGNDFDPGKPFVSDTDHQIGWLSNHGSVCVPMFNQLLSAQAGEFFINNRRNDQTS